MGAYLELAVCRVFEIEPQVAVLAAVVSELVRRGRNETYYNPAINSRQVFLHPNLRGDPS